MRLYKVVFLFLSIGLLVSKASGQEVVTPVLRNLALANNAEQKVLLNKNIKNYPVVDYFVNNGLPNKLFWLDSNITIVNRKCILNALNQQNQVYVNANNLGDVLTLNTANLAVADEYFISFTISPGSTFLPTDSCVLEIKNNLGVWQTVYTSSAFLQENSEVVISLKPEQILLNGFQARFLCYTNLTVLNTQTFLISRFVLSQKLPLPFFSVLSGLGPDSVANTNYFNGADVKVKLGNTLNFRWGNVASLNALDFKNAAYTNIGTTYGGADTFYTNPFNVSNYANNDSIVFSFAIGTGEHLAASDSFYVEFKNNLGNWVTMLALPGNAIPNFKQYVFNINWGRFRHANFTARFISKSNYTDVLPNKWLVSAFSINRIAFLPFNDDFSSTNFLPDERKWVDKNIYINNDFPLGQPSVNVATFDGLDKFGNPYSAFNIKGIADVLTSQSFNLVGLEPKDSLILSLYYQYEAQGVTNQVYPDDSLIIEFKSTAFGNDSFDIIKMISAKDATLFGFNRIDLPVLNPKYFHGNFQFRIKNRGSLTGNLSHWHVDYVRFNKGRTQNDFINDVSLTNTPKIYLGKYSSMPYRHYIINKNKYANDTVSLRIRNNDLQNFAVDYYRNIIKPEGDTLDKYNNIQPTIFANSDTIVRFFKPVEFATNFPSDSLSFAVKYKIRISGSANDEITTNDTATVHTVFDNYLAYDDGSAEGGYGIKNKLNVGACVKYTLEVPDTLYGLYIFFNQSESNISLQRFNLKVWKKISNLFEPATNDLVMYSKEYTGPTYTNFVNGFATYKIDPPLALTDSFFVGWDQISSYVLNVGLDKNYPYGVNQNQFYKMDGRWYPTEIPGALMIRPILGNFKTWPTGTLKPIAKAQEKLVVYPNPTKDYLQISDQTNSDYNFKFFDLTGRLVQEGQTFNQSIKLDAFKNGVYILYLVEPKLNKTYTHKIIIEN